MFLGHTGNLSEDAPALYSSFKQVCANGLGRLEAVYRCSFDGGGLFEGDLNRPEGVRYNPKPARICRILITELGEAKAETFGGAFLSCCESRSLSEVEFQPERQLAEKVHAYIEASAEGVERVVEEVGLALVLDRLRHLHMSKLTAAERQEFCRWAAVRVQGLAHLENKRLAVMADSCIERLSRPGRGKKKAPEA